MSRAPGAHVQLACTGCGVTVPWHGEPNVPLLTCGRCHTARYCTALCQQRDWSVHRQSCVQFVPPAMAHSEPVREDDLHASIERIASAKVPLVSVLMEQLRELQDLPPRTPTLVETIVAKLIYLSKLLFADFAQYEHQMSFARCGGRELLASLAARFGETDAVADLVQECALVLELPVESDSERAARLMQAMRWDVRRLTRFALAALTGDAIACGQWGVPHESELVPLLRWLSDVLLAQVDLPADDWARLMCESGLPGDAAQADEAAALELGHVFAACGGAELVARLGAACDADSALGEIAEELTLALPQAGAGQRAASSATDGDDDSSSGTGRRVVVRPVRGEHWPLR